MGAHRKSTQSQEKETNHFANNSTAIQILSQNQKMKVILAIQVLSLASATEFLVKEFYRHIKDFEYSEAIVEFIRSI